MIRKPEQTKTLKDVLDAMYKKYRMTQKINEIKISNAWEKITGPMISKHTTQIELKGKTLYLKFDNAPLKNEMFYRRDSLIDAINHELNVKLVEKIFIG